MFLNGYNATGIKDITDEMGIPKGSFYNHFTSKEEFGLAVLQNYCDNGVTMHKMRLIEAEGSPLQRLKSHYCYMTDFLLGERSCKLGCIMGNFSQELGDVNENFRAVLDDEFNKCQEIIVQCLSEAQTAGEIASDMDTHSLGGFILNSWHGALVRMKSTGTPRPLEDFKQLVFNQLLKKN